MLKSLLIAAAASTVVLTGCATTNAQNADLAAVSPTVKKVPLNCLTTGTRIKLKEGACANVVGRSYSKEELDRQGTFTIEEALRRLDPSVF
jgi:dUTPase